MNVTISVLDYVASRLEFFNEQKKQHEQKLHWWRNQKPYKQFSLIYIMEKCEEHGIAIAYLDDAIRALEREDKG